MKTIFEPNKKSRHNDGNALKTLKEEEVDSKNAKPVILVLGMVYNVSIDNMTQKYGQEWRDMHRILSLVNIGFTVFSMDNKHIPIIGKHCDANYNNVRRMVKSLKQQNVFPASLGAKYIILDYFFSPVSIYIYHIIYIIYIL